MGFDSNGNWSSDFYPVNDRDNSVPILASKFKTLIQSNLKQSFENCILRDGTGKPTANINFNSKKITNLANGENAGDAVNKGQLDSAVAVSASEEQQGTVQLSTSAQALAGTDDTTAMTPAKVKEVIETLADTTRFCVNSGYATDGKPNLLGGQGTQTLTFNVDDGTYYKPLVFTTAGGSSYELESVDILDVSALANGWYNVFVDSDGHSYAYQNTIYRTQSQPESMNTNDIWLNTCEPYKAYIKTVSDLVETDLVPLPQRAYVLSAGVGAFETVSYYNDNGSAESLASNYEYIRNGLFVDWSKGQSIPAPIGHTYTVPNNGLCVFYMGSVTTDLTIYVNGHNTRLKTSHSNSYQDVTSISLYVAKGDQIQIYGSNTFAYEGTFFPLKGVI